MSWNTLEIAGELGINRVVIASSVNSIGMSTSAIFLLLVDILLRQRPIKPLPTLSSSLREHRRPTPDLWSLADNDSLLKTTSIRLSTP